MKPISKSKEYLKKIAAYKKQVDEYHARRESKFDIESIIEEISNRFPEPFKSGFTKFLHGIKKLIYIVKLEELKGIFEPMQFFEIYFDSIYQVEFNAEKPLELTKVFLKYDLDEKQTFFMLYKLNDFLLQEDHYNNTKFDIIKLFIASELKRFKKLNKYNKEFNPIKKKKEPFSNFQLAMAFKISGQEITKENAANLLEKYTNNISIDNLLTYHNFNFDDYVKISKDKSADTKKYKSLMKIKKLLCEMRRPNSEKFVDSLISKLKEDYYKEYKVKL